MLAEAKYITANGVRFAYLEEGTGPLVVLVHGFPDTAHTWDDVRPALAAAGFRAVSPFTRGYAPTDVPADGKYDAETLGTDVVELIDVLSDGEGAFLVGHDWGASAAYSAATLRPEKLHGLVTLAIPHPAGIRPSPGLMWNVRHFFSLTRRNAAKKVAANDFAYVDELVRRWSPGWQVPPDETKAVKAVFANPESLDAALAYYRAAVGKGLPASQRKRVAVRTVSFAGENDIVKPEQYDRARTRYTGEYRVIRMPGGHFLHRQHPQIFNTHLVDVLVGWRDGVAA